MSRFPQQRRTVLVVEPDDHARLLLIALLERSGHRVIAAADGAEALRSFYADRPDLVLLELAGRAPGLDGWTTLERIRELSQTPVIAVTECTGELEIVRALRLGADDVVTKPFPNAVLVARVEAVLRRSTANEEPAVHDDGFVRVDLSRRSVEAGGERLHLTPLEFRLLLTMVRHPGQVLSQDQLRELVWNDSSPGCGDEVRVYIGYLRRKFVAAMGSAPIETVRGFGYRYDPAPAELALA